MANYYKPRFKKCYRTQNKIWFNTKGRFNIKSFRLWEFNRTNALVIPTIKFKLKSMKWIIIRRFMNSIRIQNRFYYRFLYSNLFKNKQQLKFFYGKIKEYQLKQIFKLTYLKQKSFKRNVFIGSLEKRLDVILYRMHFLPTIFACNQLISHQGVYVNDNIITSSNYKVKIGDIIGIKENQWNLLYNNLESKLVKRLLFQRLYLKKELFSIKKDYYNVSNMKLPFRNNYYLINEIFKIRLIFLLLKKAIKKSKNFNAYKKNKIKTLKIEYLLNYKIEPKLIKLIYLGFFLRKWKNLNYNDASLNIVLTLLLMKKYFYFIHLFLKWDDENEAKFKVLENKMKLLARVLFSQGTLMFANKINKTQGRGKDFIVRRKKAHPLKKFEFNWFVPDYLEVDYKTLRVSFINYPEKDNIIYPFINSFDNILSFYRDKGC